jgi:hypothetical protein
VVVGRLCCLEELWWGEGTYVSICGYGKRVKEAEECLNESFPRLLKLFGKVKV